MSAQYATTENCPSCRTRQPNTNESWLLWGALRGFALSLIHWGKMTTNRWFLILCHWCWGTTGEPSSEVLTFSILIHWESFSVFWYGVFVCLKSYLKPPYNTLCAAVDSSGWATPSQHTHHWLLCWECVGWVLPNQTHQFSKAFCSESEFQSYFPDASLTELSSCNYTVSWPYNL